MAEPPSRRLSLACEEIPAADLKVDEIPPFLAEVREAVNKLKGGKAAGVCNISAEMLKAVGETMIHGLHALLTAFWQSGTIPPDWKRELIVPICKGKGCQQDAHVTRGLGKSIHHAENCLGSEAWAHGRAVIPAASSVSRAPEYKASVTASFHSDTMIPTRIFSAFSSEPALKPLRFCCEVAID